MVAGKAAFGLRVLSVLNSISCCPILNCFRLPSLFDLGNRRASLPFVDVMLEIAGRDLYAEPSEIILIVPIGPDALDEVVVYFIDVVLSVL